MTKKTFLMVLCLLMVAPGPAEAARSRLILVLSPGQSSRVAGPLTERLASDEPALVGLDRTLTVVRRDHPMLDGLPLPVTTVPLLALVHPGREPSVAVEWSIEVVDPNQALNDLAGYWDAKLEQAWIDDTVLVVPAEDRALERGEIVGVEMFGTPGGLATVQVGGQADIAMTEVAPGVYRGEYTVTAEDRTEAEVSVRLETVASTQQAAVGTVLLQGIPLPEVTGVEQHDTAVWVVQGTAPPGSTVRGTVDLPGAGYANLQATADEQGRFETQVYLGRWVDSRDGTVELRAMDPEGNVVVTPQQKVWFQSKQAYRPSYRSAYPFYGFRFNFGYPGYRWYPYRIGYPGYCR